MSIHCRGCGYNGEVQVVESRRLSTGVLERCPDCKSMNIEYSGVVVMDDQKWEVDEWTGCYPSNWKGLIVPEAMSHPAKFSNRLIRRIYEHMKEEGWLKAGDTILDPFGGVALGALDAMRMGLRWVGCELEPKFVELGNWNISHWNAKFHRMPNWSGEAVLLQGDSRKLLEVVSGVKGQVSGAVSSPPYADSVNDKNRNMDQFDWSKGKRAKMGISQKWQERLVEQSHYGNTEGQLGGMKNEGFDAAISSPPFLQSEGGAHVPSKYADDKGFMNRHSAGNGSSEAYGVTEGQLGNMRDVSGFTFHVSGSVSSPPFKDQFHSHDNFIAPHDSTRLMDTGKNGYGTTDGQLGADSGDDFWMAARAIVEQVYMALEPGGHAVWVCKDFVKNKQRVAFSDQWRQLCEAVGFVTLHEHRAMLVRNGGTSQTLDGGTVVHKKEAKSFFRRLAEKKGSPRIDWEVVWCMVKP